MLTLADSRSNLLLAGNFLIYLFLLATTQDEVAAAYNLLEQYHDSLRYLQGVADTTSMALIRPSLLRAESFFHEAAEILRNGIK